MQRHVLRNRRAEGRLHRRARRVAGEDGGDSYLAGSDGDPGPRHLRQHVEAEGEARLPAGRRRVAGGLQHVGDLDRDAGGRQHGANARDGVRAWCKTHQRHFRRVAEQLQREGRRRGQRGGAQGREVVEAAHPDPLVHHLDCPQMGTLVRGGACQDGDQPVSADLGPVLPGIGKCCAQFLRRPPFHLGGRGRADLPGRNPGPPEHGHGEEDGAQTHVPPDAR